MINLPGTWKGGAGLGTSKLTSPGHSLLGLSSQRFTFHWSDITGSVGHAYLMGGLMLDERRVLADLWYIELQASSELRCIPIAASARKPNARVEHSCALCLWGGNAKIEETDTLNNLYMMNRGERLSSLCVYSFMSGLLTKGNRNMPPVRSSRLQRVFWCFPAAWALWT